MKKHLSATDLNSVLEGLVREEYHLLLGAGATVGCPSGDGRQLPVASALADQIVEDFSLPTGGEKVDLRTAYELVDGRKTHDGLNRSGYFKKRFSNCEGTWHTQLLSFRWRRIWTLNIDDVLERTFAAHPTVALQRSQPYDWSSLYSEPNRAADELQIIHLHGYAPGLDSPEAELVFSIVEYLQASAHRHAWHHVFGDEFRQRPFIVVGARLSDEFDLADFLRRGNTSRALTGRPSLVVLQSISAIQREQFEKWGLLAIESDAAEFFEFLSRERENDGRAVGLVPNTRPDMAMTRQARLFSQQFNWLRLDANEAKVRDHDFYRGDQPQWEDILAEKDASFQIVDQLLAQVTGAGAKPPEPTQRVICINGPRGSGKTAALLRSCRSLLALGYDVFVFRAEENLDIDSASWWLENGTKCVLVFDGLADFAVNVGRLADVCRRNNIPLLVVAAERESRRHQIYQGIAPEFLTAMPLFGQLRLTDQDIDNLLTRLEKARRLGILTRRSRQQRRDYFRKETKRHLLIGLMGLESGSGFIERLRDEYRSDIGEPQLRAIYGLCCMSFSFGYALPNGIAMAATGVSSELLTDALRVGGKLAAFLRSEGQGLRPRHRVIAAAVVNNGMNPRDRLTLFVALTKALAPYVTIRTIQTNSLPCRLIKQLMDEQIVHAWVGSEADKVYADLQEEYGWNARYWEQRALSEARRGSYPKAISYSEEALRMHTDAFTLTTAGSILLRMATDYHGTFPDEAQGAYWRGVKHLKQARDLAEGRYEHPFKSFFSRTLQFAQRNLSEGRDLELFDEWHRWMSAAERSMIFRHAENHQVLRAFQSDWLRLVVGS